MAAATRGSASHRRGWHGELAVDPNDIVLGLRTRHRLLGEGVVLDAEGRPGSLQVLVRFDRGGEKWISSGRGFLEFDLG